jgi:hypothetical protein
VPLAPGLPPQAAPEPDAARAGSQTPPNNGDLELVTVLQTNDPFALSLAKAALEDAGIEYMVSGESSPHAPYLHRFGPGSPLPQDYSIQVTPEFQRQARELVEPFEKPLSPAELDAEPDGPSG